jgi:hypothetical protein
MRKKGVLNKLAKIVNLSSYNLTYSEKELRIKIQSKEYPLTLTKKTFVKIEKVFGCKIIDWKIEVAEEITKIKISWEEKNEETLP